MKCQLPSAISFVKPTVASQASLASAWRERRSLAGSPKPTPAYARPITWPLAVIRLSSKADAPGSPSVNSGSLMTAPKPYGSTGPTARKGSADS